MGTTHTSVVSCERTFLITLRDAEAIGCGGGIGEIDRMRETDTIIGAVFIPRPTRKVGQPFRIRWLGLPQYASRAVRDASLVTGATLAISRKQDDYAIPNKSGQHPWDACSLFRSSTAHGDRISLSRNPLTRRWVSKITPVSAHKLSHIRWAKLREPFASSPATNLSSSSLISRNPVIRSTLCTGMTDVR